MSQTPPLIPRRPPPLSLSPPLEDTFVLVAILLWGPDERELRNFSRPCRRFSVLSSQNIAASERTATIHITAIRAFSIEVRPGPPVGCAIGVPVGDDVWVAVEVVRDKPVIDVVPEVVPVGESAPSVGDPAKLVVKSQVVGAALPFEYTEKTLPLKPS